MALEKRRESSINMFLTHEPNFSLDQGLEDKISSDLYHDLPELSHNFPDLLLHEHVFHRTISDPECTATKVLPSLNMLDDVIKHSSLPTPIAGSKYDSDIYWNHTDNYAKSLNDPNIYGAYMNSHSSSFTADPRFYGAHESSYLSPISPRMNKKHRSLDDNSSDTLLKTTITTARKKTIVNTCECSGGCGGQIASIYMRGHVHELEKSYMIDVICSYCSDELQSASKFLPFQYVHTTRKRSRDEQKIVECDVCRKKIGNGGIRPIESDVAEDLTVEFVCTSCTSKYQFCSECGGGGKSRTGKWRPIEMFEKGRRTCALPHVRVGDSQFNTISYSQTELTGSILSQIQDVFFDSYLSYYAGPSFMEINNQSFHQLIQDTIYPIWQNGVFTYISSPTPKNVSRFYVVEWMHKQHRNKAKAKVQKEEGSNGWLKIIKDRTSIIKLNQTCADNSLGDNNCVSFGIAEWNHEKKTVVFPQILPRSFFTKSLQTYERIITSTINSIHMEAFRNRISMPLYVILYAQSDNTKVRGIPERLGFLEKELFVLDHPSSKKLLDELDYPILKTKNALIHVSSIEELLQRQ